MTKQELENRLKELDVEHKAKRNKVIVQYCNANNPYKVGDKFTDHSGSIIIESIRYAFSSNNNPCCVYFGTELKKDGTPKKNKSKRSAWQSNESTSIRGVK